MNFNEGKYEIVALALVTAIIGGVFFLGRGPVQTYIATHDLVYEMPRPKTFFAALFGLGLEDREISRKYVNPFEGHKDDQKKVTPDKAVTKAVSAVSKKDAPTSKSSEQAVKKPQVSINVVDQDKKPFDTNSFSGRATSGGYHIAVNAPAAQSNTGQNPQEGLSSEQWRALIIGQPTKENMGKLVDAYMTSQVDSATFYSIISELLTENKADTQDLGIYGASSFYNSQSFSVVASSYDQLLPENQAKAQTYLLSYAKSGRGSVLLNVLKSKSPVVLELALQVVIKGYQDAKANIASAIDPRNSRGDFGVTATSLSDYQSFVPILQQLSQSTDSNLASQASSVLNQIQSGVAAL